MTQQEKKKVNEEIEKIEKKILTLKKMYNDTIQVSLMNQYNAELILLFESQNFLMELINNSTSE